MYTRKHFTLDYAKVRKAAFIVETLQNQRRQRILDLLDLHGALEANQLAAELKLSIDTINEHLAALRRTGVVKILRKNRQVFYFLDDSRLETIVNAVHRFLDKSTDKVLQDMVEEI